MATKKAKKVSGKTGRVRQRAKGRDSEPVTPPPKWTFLTNHAHVLTVLDSEPGLVLREVALRVGITERAVQRIIVELEESGFLLRERIGRRNHYKVLKNQPLRHPVEAHRKIGDLLKLIQH
ncbi:helix-turn-helix transcriptional regulator [Planctomycetota bacterium]